MRYVPSVDAVCFKSRHQLMISMRYRESRGSYWLIAADQRKVISTKSSIDEENVYILLHSAGGQVLHVSKNKIFDLEKNTPEIKKKISRKPTSNKILSKLNQVTVSATAASYVEIFWAKRDIFGANKLWVWGNVLDASLSRLIYGKLGPRIRLWSWLTTFCLYAR